MIASGQVLRAPSCPATQASTKESCASLCLGKPFGPSTSSEQAGSGQPYGKLRAGKFPTLRLACPHRTAWIRIFQGIFSLDINRMEVSSSYVLAHCLNTPLAA